MQSVQAAREAIAAALKACTGEEVVPLAQALGRVLAHDCISPMDVPPHDNSAMDGYAFDGRLLQPGCGLELVEAGTELAGAPWVGTLRSGECLRIMTGAMMPAGLDTVAPLELCRSSDGRVQVQAGAVKRGDNLRRRGEDLATGQPALFAGRVLKPADLGLLASLGLAEVPVRQRLRVALFSTGHELCGVGKPLAPGSVYDSNRFSLAAAVQRLGMDVLDLGIVPDDEAALSATLEHAVAQADVVLTSGGVSMGDADFTRDVLARLGEVSFWKIAMQPGRPFAFGALRAPHRQQPAWLFALPGNPVAALVAFYVLAREGLLQLAGAAPEPLPMLRARSGCVMRKKPGRTEFQRGIVEAGTRGWQVRLTGAQGSGVLHSMSRANALVVLGPEQGPVAEGDWVDVWLFDGLT